MRRNNHCRRHTVSRFHVQQADTLRAAPDSRMVLESMRMILPYWLISMTSELSAISENTVL